MKDEKNRPETNESEIKNTIDKFEIKPDENNNTNNNENKNSIVQRFGRFVNQVATDRRATIKISELQKIEKEMKTGEAIQIVDIKEFAKLIGLSENTDALTIRNKLYRSYQKGEISMKPVMRERTLYLVRK